MNKAHVHFQHMYEYLEDARTSEKPWENWQFQYENSELWHDAKEELAFIPHNKYRRKPKTININGIEVPEPVRKELEIDEIYYFPDVREDGMVDWYSWDNDITDRRLLKAGMIHLTKEAAEIHAKALLSLTEVKE